MSDWDCAHGLSVGDVLAAKHGSRAHKMREDITEHWRVEVVKENCSVVVTRIDDDHTPHNITDNTWSEEGVRTALAGGALRVLTDESLQNTEDPES